MALARFSIIVAIDGGNGIAKKEIFRGIVKRTLNSLGSLLQGRGKM